MNLVISQVAELFCNGLIFLALVLEWMGAVAAATVALSLLEKVHS
jgi:hypothetical protein